MIGAILIVMMIARAAGRSLGAQAAWRLGPTARGAGPRARPALAVAFGGLRALSDSTCEVGEGEVVSVIGPNGAGKTTVFNVITGVYKPSAGDVRLRRRVDRRAAAAHHRPAGVARTFQSLRLFLNMSVHGERDGRDLRRAPRRCRGSRSSRLPRARREEREAAGAGRGRAVVLRPAAGRVPLGPARLLAVLREPAAAGDRPRARHQAAGCCCSTSLPPG